jgi:hypothetical protein
LPACRLHPVPERQNPDAATTRDGLLSGRQCGPAQQQVLNGVPNDPTKPGIIAMNAAVCAAGGQINVTDLQTLAATGFPALLGLVEALPMLPNQPDIVFGLILAQPILTQIVNQLTNPAAPAAPASGASAPVPASA